VSQSVSILPLFDRILCQRVTAPHTTEGGLVIPEAARERPQEAVVIAVGCGKALDHTQRGVDVATGIPIDYPVYRRPLVHPGDTILIGKYAGAEVSVGAQNYLILREDEILGIINVMELPDAEPVPVGEENA
jgi:chaperonin GroES